MKIKFLKLWAIITKEMQKELPNYREKVHISRLRFSESLKTEKTSSDERSTNN